MMRIMDRPMAAVSAVNEVSRATVKAKNEAAMILLLGSLRWRKEVPLANSSSIN
jgi:hypothetical protein